MNRTEARQLAKTTLEGLGLFAHVYQSEPETFGGATPVAVLHSKSLAVALDTRDDTVLPCEFYLTIYVARPRDGDRDAVEAALEMSQVLEDFRQELGELGQHFDVGIGIHSGLAVVGFIGAQARLDYTAIGDTVNLASRIEGLTKGVSRILVSDATRLACADHYDFVPHGSHQVKGREQAVALFEPRTKALVASQESASC